MRTGADKEECSTKETKGYDRQEQAIISVFVTGREKSNPSDGYCLRM